mmetsp:Transcript_47584/g.123246  ORF Transcript_47584/g.123246 Transcript_47584/m.123246 type:complete len:231 (-) Transcript_47584:2037-2729(-)
MPSKLANWTQDSLRRRPWISRTWQWPRDTIHHCSSPQCWSLGEWYWLFLSQCLFSCPKPSLLPFPKCQESDPSDEFLLFSFCSSFFSFFLFFASSFSLFFVSFLFKSEEVNTHQRSIPLLLLFFFLCETGVKKNVEAEKSSAQARSSPHSSSRPLHKERKSKGRKRQVDRPPEREKGCTKTRRTKSLWASDFNGFPRECRTTCVVERTFCGYKCPHAKSRGKRCWKLCGG